MISILLATYNNNSYLNLCLDSIYKNTGVPFEVILWDNSGNKSKRLSKAYANLTHIGSDTNVGLSKPRNYMAAKAKYDIIMFSDDDTYFLPDWDIICKELVNEHSWRIPNVIGPNQVWGIQDNFGSSLDTFDVHGLLKKYSGYIHPQRVWACLPTMALRKADYFEIGGYDESCINDEQGFLYSSWLFYHKYGRPQLNHPKSCIYHFGTKTQRPSNWRSSIFKRHAELEKIYNKSIHDQDIEMSYWKFYANTFDTNGNFIELP